MCTEHPHTHILNNPIKKCAKKHFTFSSITHCSSLALIAASLHNLHAVVAMQAGTHLEQCTEQSCVSVCVVCVFVFVTTPWFMQRDKGEAINEYSVLATSCFPVNIAVSVHECASVC